MESSEQQSPELFDWVQLRTVLVQRRQELKLSQRALAAAMGTTQSAVSDLETGNTWNPGLDTVIRWAAALGGTITMNLEIQPVVTPGSSRQIVLGAPERTTVVAYEQPTYSVHYSEQDECFVATVAEYPSLSYVDGDRQAALDGLARIVADILADEDDADWEVRRQRPGWGRT